MKTIFHCSSITFHQAAERAVSRTGHRLLQMCLASNNNTIYCARRRVGRGRKEHRTCIFILTNKPLINIFYCVGLFTNPTQPIYNSNKHCTIQKSLYKKRYLEFAIPSFDYSTFICLLLSFLACSQVQKWYSKAFFPDSFQNLSTSLRLEIDKFQAWAQAIKCFQAWFWAWFLFYTFVKLCLFN